MANSWIEHVRAYARKHNISYSQAMKAAGASYKKGGKKSGKKQSKKDKRDEKKGMKGKKKGSKSKTDKGEEDFTTKKGSRMKGGKKGYSTKKGSKDFHEGGKDVKKSRKPYMR